MPTSLDMRPLSATKSRPFDVRALPEACGEGIATLDSEGRFLYHNAAAKRILGAAPEELIGTSFLTSLHPLDKTAAIETFEMIASSAGSRVKSDYRFLHPDGAWHWLSCEWTNAFDNPDVGAVIATFHDITPEREAERNMRESEQRFREMAAHIKEAFFVTDARTMTTQYMSPHWAEIFGRPLSDAYESSKWLECIHPEDRQAMSDTFEQTARGESTDKLFRVQRPDSTIRWVRGRTVPVRDASGRVQRIVGIATDVTELRATEERFTQAQKMEAVGRLAGGVAHDFNNLLTVIIAEADMMITDDKSDKKDLGLLKEIRSAAESAVVLTKQLLAFSRRELVVPTIFVIDDAVQETSRMLRRLIGEDIRFTVNLSAGAAHVCMDRGQLEQVLANLVVNSRDAMPHGGALSIVTSVESTAAGNRVVLCVSDTGCGMSEEVRARAFEPFFTTKTHGKGTGLGLATCHGIIAQANGEIDVTSQQGVGTTFRISLPKQHGVRTDLQDTAVPSPRGNESVLLVEDDTGVRRVSARMLRSLGYSVIEARDAQDVRRMLTAGVGDIDILITDVVMPGMGGRELADMFRQERPNIKVVYATGYTDDVILHHQVLEEDVPLLRKPFTSACLARTVRDALDGRYSPTPTSHLRSVA